MKTVVGEMRAHCFAQPFTFPFHMLIAYMIQEYTHIPIGCSSYSDLFVFLELKFSDGVIFVAGVEFIVNN